MNRGICNILMGMLLVLMGFGSGLAQVKDNEKEGPPTYQDITEIHCNLQGDSYIGGDGLKHVTGVKVTYGVHYTTPEGKNELWEPMARHYPGGARATHKALTFCSDFRKRIDEDWWKTAKLKLGKGIDHQVDNDLAHVQDSFGDPPTYQDATNIYCNRYPVITAGHMTGMKVIYGGTYAVEGKTTPVTWEFTHEYSGAEKAMHEANLHCMAFYKKLNDGWWKIAKKQVEKYEARQTERESADETRRAAFHR